MSLQRELAHGQERVLFGDEALSHGSALRLQRPVQRGIVRDWDGMQKFYGDVFYNQLRVAPEEHDVFCTEALLNPIANREKTTEVHTCPGRLLM